MTTVCVLGSGARELALVRALKRSSKCGAVRCFGAEPNPGIAELAGAVEVGDETSPDAVLAFCKGGKADLVIAGGTASRSGVVDVLLGGGIRVVGARKAAAAVADVDFARDLMKQVRAPRAGPPAAHSPTHGLRPRSRAGSRHRHFALEAPPLPYAYAIRPLAPEVRCRRACYFVMCCVFVYVRARSRAPCVSYIQFKIHACIAEGSGCPFVRAGGEGQQFSILSFCDGATCVHMPPMQSFLAPILKSQLS